MAEITNSSAENRSGKTTSSRMSTRIDMTPMVDLAFLLLTFFMLTTSFLTPYVMQVSMPEKVENNPQPTINVKKVLTLVLGEKDKIYWYAGHAESPLKVTDFSREGVRKLLMEKNATVQGLYVFIKPTDESRYQNMVDIFDEMAITGIKRYSLSEMTPEDSKLMKEASLISQLIKQ